MCATCGCSDDSKARLIDMQSGETVRSRGRYA